MKEMTVGNRSAGSAWLSGQLGAVVEEAERSFEDDDSGEEEPLTPEQELEQRRSELRNGLTDMQRLFLFGKLGGLNDKDAAIAAGYSLSVAQNTKQRIWKPRVTEEFARVKCLLLDPTLQGRKKG